MGKLFEMRKGIDRALSGRKDEFVIRGQIGMEAGLLVGGINEKTLDDPEKIAKLARAIKAVLGIDI